MKIEDNIIVPKSLNGILSEETSSDAINILQQGSIINKSYKISLLPLDKVYTDTRAFQNRKKAYSEGSVNGIIEAVLKDEFLIHMFDPIRVWRNPKNDRLFVLSGHSRFEAFQRLSTDPLKSDERVIAFCKKHNMSFDAIPSLLLPEGISFEQAKFIALTSNNLATHETDMERAIFYRELRNLDRLTKGEYEDRLRQYEKANAKKIDAFSYLNPNGKTAELVESFEMNGDTNGDLRKVAYWIGIVRKKNEDISNLHENELLDWLFLKGNYGTQQGQFFKFETFWEFFSGHVELLKQKGEFDKSNSLNLEAARSVSLAMQAYAKILRELRMQKIEVNKIFNEKIRTISRQIIDGKKTADLFDSTDEVEDIFETPLGFKHAFAALEEKLGMLVEGVQTEADVHKVHAEMTKMLASITMKIQNHKGRRQKYLDAAQQEQTLF